MHAAGLMMHEYNAAWLEDASELPWLDEAGLQTWLQCGLLGASTHAGGASRASMHCDWFGTDKSAALIIDSSC